MPQQVLTTNTVQTIRGWQLRLDKILSGTLSEEEKLVVLQRELAQQVEGARYQLQQCIAAEKSLQNPEDPESIPSLTGKITEYKNYGKTVLGPQYKKYQETPEIEEEEAKIHEQMQQLSARIETMSSRLQEQQQLLTRYQEITSIWQKQYDLLRSKYQNLTQQGPAKLRHLRALQATNQSLAAARRAASGLEASPETTLTALDAAINQETNMYNANTVIEGQVTEFDPDKLIAAHRAQTQSDKNISDWIS